MNIEYEYLYNLTEDLQNNLAQEISGYTQGRTGEIPQMLPVTSADVLNKYLGLVALANDGLAGFVAASQPEMFKQCNMSEIGTLWVPKEHQKMGIGHDLVRRITMELLGQDVLPYGFCNQFSLKVFLDNDFFVQKTEAVPDSALSLCASCPKLPKSGCCDTIVVYGAIDE